MGLFGSSSKKTTSTQTPWGPQAGYLTDAFSRAQGLADQGLEYYPGETYAGPTDLQTGGLNQLADYYTQGLGGQLGGMFQQGANPLLGGYGQAAGYYQDTLGGGNQLGTAQFDFDLANQAASSPYARGLIEASTRDVYRNLKENQLTGVDSQAAITGNSGASKHGAAGAILQRGAQDRAADISSQILSGFEDRGFRVAGDQQRLQQQSNLTNFSARQGAAQNLANLAGTGYGMLGQANQYNIGAGTGQMGLGQAQQGWNQAAMTDAQQRHDAEQNLPWENLQRYWNVIGQQSWGGTTTNKQSGGQSGLGKVVSSVGRAVAAYYTFGGSEALGMFGGGGGGGATGGTGIGSGGNLNPSGAGGFNWGSSPQWGAALGAGMQGLGG